MAQRAAGGAAVPRSDSAVAEPVPSRDCPLCPRLADFRAHWRGRQPDWFNAPVPAFGPVSARLAIVGLAPGLRGANRTGRPFTGDFAGDLLYATLAEFGFSEGQFAARPDDGLRLTDARIINAVRCVPPGNKPTPAEIAQCRPFLAGALSAMPDLAAIVVLGRIAHDSVLAALGRRASAAPFAHAAVHEVAGLPPARGQTGAPAFGASVRLYDSYHCSRLNTNTGVLTPDMFRAVFAAVRAQLDG